tara:strand:+ start:349 stop:534 length:186 start_codon:yes stop_codon:yes gene_type:complete
MDYSKIEIVQIDGINHEDYPDYCDAYIVEARYDGHPLTEKQLDEINDNSQFVHKSVEEYIN